MAPRARICLTGPESTGKSELARRLARELGAACVPEFARDYAQHLDRDLTADDVEPIAAGCIAYEERHAADAELVLLDTDLISTVVYARHYYGACPQWIERAAAVRRADLYLLMDIDVAWKPDPARDADPSQREVLFVKFSEALEEYRATYRVVSGAWEVRYRLAAALVSEVTGSAIDTG
ncbi:MAG TPA: ATP-binding protein [Thermoanaerobaculia bacterium]